MKVHFRGEDARQDPEEFILLPHPHTQISSLSPDMSIFLHFLGKRFFTNTLPLSLFLERLKSRRKMSKISKVSSLFHPQRKLLSLLSLFLPPLCDSRRDGICNRRRTSFIAVSSQNLPNFFFLSFWFLLLFENEIKKKKKKQKDETHSGHSQGSVILSFHSGYPLFFSLSLSLLWNPYITIKFVTESAKVNLLLFSFLPLC